MLKKVLAAATLAGAIGIVAAPALADPAACLHVEVHVDDQGTTQDVCTPV